MNGVRCKVRGGSCEVRGVKRFGEDRGGKNCLPLFGICSHGLKEVRGVGTPNPFDSVLFLKDCREARGK